jgi:hypothetical protein
MRAKRYLTQAMRYFERVLNLFDVSRSRRSMATTSFLDEFVMRMCVTTRQLLEQPVRLRTRALRRSSALEASG